MGDTAQDQSFQFRSPSGSHHDHIARFNVGNFWNDIAGPSFLNLVAKRNTAFFQERNKRIQDTMGAVLYLRNRHLKIGFAGGNWKRPVTMQHQNLALGQFGDFHGVFGCFHGMVGAIDGQEDFFNLHERLHSVNALNYLHKYLK